MMVLVTMQRSCNPYHQDFNTGHITSWNLLPNNDPSATTGGQVFAKSSYTASNGRTSGEYAWIDFLVLIPGVVIM